MNNCLKGLLLVGGKSSRMGTDKSEMVFRDGLSQRERGEKLLGTVCNEVFISVHEGEGKNIISDAFPNAGPLGAIASAQQAHPGETWLVLACDLPLLEEQHLAELVKLHTGNDATFYTSATDGFPEPLCAIWGPATETAVRESLQNGRCCPRSVLKKITGNALPSPGLWPLANTNTEADAIEIRARLDNNLTEKTVTLSHYAQLRELTGKVDETHRTESATPAGVFEELRAKYQLPLKRKNLMVAVNGDFTDWTHALADGDEIVFIPPVAGG